MGTPIEYSEFPLFSQNLDNSIDDIGIYNINSDDDVATNDVSRYQQSDLDSRRGTWPKIKEDGPNINIKLPRRSFQNPEERDFFNKQIVLKQKTEVYKN
jgi:hypothetical protein